MSRRRIRKRRIEGRAPEKPKMKILLNFGIHATGVNARPIRKHVEEFRPHVLVIESTYTLEEEREEENRLTNQVLHEARANPLKRADRVASAKSLFGWGVVNVLLATKGLWTHYVEAYSAKQLQEFARIKHECDDPTRPILLMHEGKIAEALRLREKLIREAGVHWIGPRDKRILRGFGGLGAELREEYGLGKGGSEVRVFARFGPAHASLGNRLREMGFDAESVQDAQTPLPSYRMLARLSENPKGRISRDECAELLFETAWSIKGGLLQNAGEEEVAEDFKKKFERVGLADGFLALLSDAAKKESLHEWVKFIKSRIHGE